MPLYRIQHRECPVAFQTDLQATSPEDACKRIGLCLDEKRLTVGDCFIRVQTPRVKNPKAESGWSGGGWRNVTTKEIYCRNLLDGNCIVPGYSFHNAKKCSSLLNEACKAKGGMVK